MALRINNKLWVISDTHFGHQNIIKFCARPANHELIMLSEWARLVNERHQILHLGDVFMGRNGNPERWARLVARMPGEKFLIKGNHDKAADSLYEGAGFTIIEPFVHDGYAFTHRPISVNDALDAIWDGQWESNIHGHIHNNGYQTEFGDNLIDGKTYINVSVEVTNLSPVQLGGIWKR